jgi:hypothetical protein
MEHEKDVSRYEQNGSKYEKPEVRDYGDLRELTQIQAKGHHTDVPLGTPVNPPFSIFSF